MKRIRDSPDLTSSDRFALGRSETPGAWQRDGVVDTRDEETTRRHVHEFKERSELLLVGFVTARS